MAIRQPNQSIIAAAARPFSISAILILIALLCITHAYGQSITADGSLGTQVTVDNSNYTISEGAIRGGNQFHSFGKFNVFTGESATFTGPAAINNIIGRVTGGDQSVIDGLLKSDIDGANLFLVNPSGVIFGENASLEVSGSFHVTTADYLRLGDGGIFYANLSENSTLAIDPPSAFGFLNGNPAGITIQESSLEVPAGETISIVGGDIDIVGDGTVDDAKLVVVAPSGRINLASVASSGEVVLNSPGDQPDLIMESFASLGNIDVSNSAFIDARGNPGGHIIIRGGNFYLTESLMSAATNGDLDHPGIAIDMKISDNMVLTGGELNDAEISSSSLSTATGNAGDIEIEAGNLELTGAPEFFQIADIASRVFFEGDGGDISIKTGDLHVNKFSIIVAQVFGSGDGGDMTIDADSLVLDGGPSLCFISTSTFSPWNTETSGNAGDLTVNANEIIVQGGDGGFTGMASQVAGGDIGNPDGGQMIVNTNTLQLFDGGQLNAGIFRGSGQAGNIEVTADEILISGKNSGGFSAGIYSAVSLPDTTGTGGDIVIDSNDLQMISSGQIGTYSESPGDSGNLIVNTENLTITNGSFLSSTNFGGGEAGDITVDASNMLLAGPSPDDGFTGVFAIGGAFATGSGDINVRTDQLQIINGAQISAQTSGPGMGGRIDIIADQVSIGGIDPNSTSTDGPSAGIFSSSTVFGGLVDQATGDAGNINVRANNFNLNNQGAIGAYSTSQGDGGSINIHADNAISADNGFISTAAKQAVGGNIILTGPEMELTNQTVISAESSGEGDAGDIFLNASDMFWMANSTVSTEAEQADGGNIKIDADGTVCLWDSTISASVGGGPDTTGGNISIDPEYVTLSNSQIIANAFEGTGGNIQIVTDQFVIDLNSIISASSEYGLDGSVDIQTGTSPISEGITPLPEEFQSAVALLRETCLARMSDGPDSSLLVGPTASHIMPGGMLPTPTSVP